MTPQDTGHFEAPEHTGSDKVTSDLDSLMQLVEKNLSAPVRLTVKALPGVWVEYRTDIEQDDLDEIAKRSRKKVNGKFETDMPVFFRQILAETCEGIYQDGVAKLNSEGEVVTFRDPELNAKFGFETPDTVALVHMFFKKRDGEINGHCERILKAAGFGEDVEDADVSDPTKGA